MCRAHRTTICFPVISSPTACTLLEQQATLVIGFILFLPLLCIDQLYLFCSPIRDSLLRRPHLPCCSWARALTAPDGRKAVSPSHGCCRAKYNRDFMVQEFRTSSGPSSSSPHPTLPGSCCVPTVTTKHLLASSAFALCTAHQLWTSP